MILVEEVTSKKGLKQFVKFPFALYKNNKYWVPPIIKEEVDSFNKTKNPVFEHADAQFFLAYKNNTIVGRVAAIINWTEVNNQQIKKMRFGWFDVIDDIDVVSGVPDSGMAHGLGYAMESNKPFRRPLVKYTSGYGRSYTPPSQKTRDLVAKMKLIAIKEVIDGNSIVICEDSIVRGTQLKNFTVKKLWDCGAKELHVRPACPPLMFPCKFNLSTRSIHELAARKAVRGIEGHDVKDVSEYIDHTTAKYKQMIDWIARDIGVTTLRYQTVDDMVKAVGLPKEKMCMYCWTGQCPKSRGEKPRIGIKEMTKPAARASTKVMS